MSFKPASVLWDRQFKGELLPGKNDVKIAKIYLSGIKLKIHNNFVSGFFDLAEEINH